jgi:hypothetical protein
MSRALYILLTFSILLVSCKELSFHNEQKSTGDSGTKTNVPAESESQDTTNTEDTSNSDKVTEIDISDTTPLSCNGSYPITLVSAENITTGTTDANLIHLYDGDKTNDSYWQSENTPQEIVMQLNNKALLKDFVISWQKQDVNNYFEIASSLDKENWQPLITNGQSKKNYIIADKLSLNTNQQTAYFLKLTLNGNSLNNQSGVIEFEAFGCHQDTQHDIELIDWYLSVQTDEDGNGKSDSIKESTLSEGYEDPRFFYVSEDEGLVFSSTIKGYKTSENTSYVRSELREMLRKGNSSHKTQGVNKNNWVFSSAPQLDQNNAGGVDGILNVDVAVNHVTSTGEDYQIGRVIIGQIHANDDEPVRLYYRKLPNNDKGSIYIAHEILDGDDSYYSLIGSRDNSASNPTNGIELNEKFSYQIKVVGNELTVTITKENGDVFSKTVDMSKSGYDKGGQYMYFKAGVYNQNNSGDLHDYVQATFYKIENLH